METKTKRLFILGSAGAMLPMVSHAAADPAVTAGITALQTSFTDNFGPVVAAFLGFVAAVWAVNMLQRYFKKAK